MVSASLLAAVALASSASSPVPAVDAFAPPALGNGIRPTGALYAADDASAQTLSDYMAKSHVEKLKAVKDVEDRKNAEIKALKEEIEQLKSSSALAVPAGSAAPLASVPTSDAEAKLASYQSFLAEYIVNAQNQKLLAVREAELKAEKKFQEKLEKLLEASGATVVGSAPAEEVVEAVPVAEESLYMKRNAQVVAAAAAGKSRWGNMEVEKVAELVAAAPAEAAAEEVAPAAMQPTHYEMRNAQVAAAGDKSRWGSMEVERVKKEVASTAAQPAHYEMRNAQVAAAGDNSRWGSMEVERARNGAAMPAVVEEVKPVTLEDRVNLGARLAVNFI